MIRVDLDYTDLATERLQRLRSAMSDRSALHAEVAAAAESFVKEYGATSAADKHTTANRLGGKPTNHLLQAFRSIEAGSDAQSAELRVPRGSRLRAAFGSYTVRPAAGRKFITIPVAAEAYGRRAGELGELIAVRVGAQKTPYLARKTSGAETLQLMYLLARKADIPEDTSLIPFAELAAEAADAAAEYLEGAMEGGDE